MKAQSGTHSGQWRDQHFFKHPAKTRITMLHTKLKDTRLQKAAVIIVGIFICIALLIIQSDWVKKISDGYDK